jgi:hypothetical protein
MTVSLSRFFIKVLKLFFRHKKGFEGLYYFDTFKTETRVKTVCLVGSHLWDEKNYICFLQNYFALNFSHAC